MTVHIMSTHLHTLQTPQGSVKALHKHSAFGAETDKTSQNSLLQDISIFMGHDTTLLEDWLVDIETATDLTMESRTELAQGKPRGLTHTLITEAITSGKSWEDIKDLL